MSKTLVVILIILLGILSAALCALSVILFINNRDLKKEIQTLKTTIEADDTGDQDGSDTDTGEEPSDGCEQSSDDAEVAVFTPCDGDEVGDKLTISGLARAFENTITVEVLSEGGESLYKKGILTDATDVGLFGNYSVDVDSSDFALGTLTVKVYIPSAKDGSDKSVVEVEVNHINE